MRDSEKIIRKLSSGATKSFAELAIERGYVTAAQIEEAKRKQKALEAKGVQKELGDVLVDQGLISPEQSRAIGRALRGATVIAGFEILEKVGQGGMGAVFRARQIGMDRVVALKILPPKLAADAGFKERFLREARLSAKLNHLNIINGIDCGEEAGYTYFAMEFVEGTTARQIIKKKGKVNLEDCYSITKQIGDALDYASKHSLVHRDIKPENIMVTPQGIAKLCDLGLAKQSENSEDASLTQSGQAVGTPHYISPEQARGEKDVDIRSDIYSLGATLYHMLTGQTPFDGATAASIMAKHLAEEARSVCDMEPDVPEAWGAIVAKMMAKDPGDRYESPKALNEDLEAAYNGGVVEALSFRGQTSCAMPRRGGRRVVPPTQSVSKQAKADVRKGTTGHLAPINVGDRTTRHVTAVQPRHESVPSGLLIGLGVAMVALVAFLMMPRDSAPPARPSPPRTVTQNEQPVRNVYESKVPEKTVERPSVKKQEPAEPARGEPERPPVEISLEPAGRRIWFEDFEDGTNGKFSPDPGRLEVAQVNGRKALKATNDKYRIGANHPGLATENGLFLEFDLLSSGLKAITVSYRVKGPEGFGRYNEIVQPESQNHWVHIHSSLRQAQKVDGPWIKPDGLTVQHIEIFGLKMNDASTSDFLAIDNAGMYEGGAEALPVAQQPATQPSIQKPPAKPPENTAALPTAEVEATYGAFLSEMVAKASTADLSKALVELKRLASGANYKVATKDIEAELVALEAAVKFEAAAMENLGKKKGAEVVVAQNALRKTFNNDRGKISGLDSVRGLDVNVKGGGVWLQAHEIDPSSMAEAGVGLDSKALVEFLIVRNRLNDAEAKAGELAGKDKEAAERRLGLLRKYQKEAEARQAFAALKDLESAKKWPVLAEEATAFENNHKETEFARQQALQIAALKKEAQEGMKSEKPVVNAVIAENLNVLFVYRLIGNGELGPGDKAVKEHLERLHFNITMKEQDQATAADADGKALVIVSSTVSGSKINSRFRDVRAPVLVWEIRIFRDMGMATRDDRDNGTRVQIVNGDSPLSSGLSGVVEIQSAGGLSWGTPGNNAKIIAHVEGQPDHAVLFAYEQGVNLTDGKPAAGKRIGIFLNDESAASVNENGWKLFEAATRWAVGDTKTPVPASTPKPSEKFESGKLFKTKSVMKVDGSLEAIWTPADALAFADDWQLDDPRQRNAGEKFMQVGPSLDVLVTLKGVAGEMWDGERRNAPFVVLHNVKPEKFRLEVAYAVPRAQKDRDSWTAGLGLWNGGRSGIIFGARRLREGPLSIWGTLNGQEVNERNLPRNAQSITMDRGQFAIISDGKDWTFYYREANEMAVDSWRRVHSIPAVKGHFPTLAAFSWDEQPVEITYYAVRLTIAGDDPSLKGK